MGGLRTSWCCILKILWILPLFLLLHQVDCAVGEQCGELPKLPNVEVVGTPGRPPYPVGTTIDIRCEDGYLPKMTKTATCQITSGSVAWIMPSLSCVPVNCPEPEGIENGERKGHVFTFPNSVNYTCFPGYELIGEKRRHCNAEGKWSGRPPKCRAIECPALQNISNGIVTVSSFKYKGIARYTCNPTFVVRGNEIRECQANKTWSGTEPRCEEARCFVPSHVPGGRVIPLVENLPGKGLMIYECDDGQRVTLKCLNTGQWDHKFPNCAINVKPTSSSAKSDCKLDESNFPNGAVHGVAKHGEVRVLKCKSNYELKGSANVSCKNGKWEPGLPKCVKHFPTMLVVIVSVGIALFFVMVCGGVVWYRIKKKRRLQRSTGSNSKARLSDARNYEEMKYLGKDRPEKPIPVTVL